MVVTFTLMVTACDENDRGKTEKWWVNSDTGKV